MNVTITQLLPSPVKGLPQQQLVGGTTLGTNGNVGSDRPCYFRSVEDNTIINGKWAIKNNAPHFFRIEAKYSADSSTVTLSLPSSSDDSFSMAEDTIPFHADEAMTQWLSQALKLNLSIHRDKINGRPDDRKLGSFTFLSENSAIAIASWSGWSAEEAIARLRPTVMVNGLDAFQEYSLIGREFSVGESYFEAVQACRRCSVPSAEPGTGVITEDFEENFGTHMRAELVKWATEKHQRRADGYYACINTRAVNVVDGAEINIGDELIFE